MILNFKGYLPNSRLFHINLGFRKRLLHFFNNVSPIQMSFCLSIFSSLHFHFTLLHLSFLRTLISKILDLLDNTFPSFCKFFKISQKISAMAPKKSAQIKSSPSNPTTKISDLIRDCNILSSINIRHLT